jgi:hypothetical protein
MRLTQATLFLAALLALGACDPDEPKPPPTPQLGEVTVSCQPASVALGGSAQCTPSAKDQDGNPFTVSSYSWTSSAPAVATVDPAGKVTPVSVGTTNITASATAGGVTRQGQAAVTVTAAPAVVHNGNVTANETWRAANNPHVVEGTIEVIGATLTIEAGVEIRFSQDAELRITTGMLKAQGTQQAPIRMVSNQGTPTKGYWRGVVFSAGGGSTMSYTTVSHCGSASGDDACIVLASSAAPVLQNVTVQNSGTAGVSVADDGSAFGAGSTVLSVSDSGSFAVRIAANQASSIPAGSTFTNNAPNAIELYGDVSRTQTWPNPGVPFFVNDHVEVQGANTPSLTISAGTVLGFGADRSLSVGSAAPGELVVIGTSGSRVFFTADSPANERPGHWRGVHLGPQSSSATRLTYATIEYAGAGGSVGTGNLNIYGNLGGGGARPKVENVTVRNGSGDGVYIRNDGAFGADSTTLTASDNRGYAVSVEANYVYTIPSGGTFTNNAPNAVQIVGGNVITTQTWPTLGIPYVIDSTVNVGSASTAQLTLPAGTELRFSQGVDFQIGSNQPGALIAVGTTGAPIRFVPNAVTPTKGHWRGLHFWMAAGSQLDRVLVSHAGAGGSIGTGNVNVYREIGAFVTNSTLSESSGCGIEISSGSQTGSTAVTTNFLQASYTNTFPNNTGGRQCIIN